MHVQQPLDTIFIQALRVDCVVGMWPQEREHAQPLLFDVELSGAFNKIEHDGDLEATVDYAAVADLITAVVQQGQFELLEVLAEQVCGAITQQFAVSAVTLTVCKPNAIANARAAGVRIYRRVGEQPHEFHS